MKTKLILLLFVVLAQISTAQNVNIPDANFKSALIANTAINTNSDSEISVTEAQNFTGEIDVYNKNISNLIGIEEFVNIIYLACHNNPQLNTIDISKNTKLTTFACVGNNMLSLDVSANTELQYLLCNNNQLTSLDVSANTALGYLYCYNNKLTSLDVSSNTELQRLDCHNNSDLSEICVWDIDYANSNSDFTKDASATWTTDCATSEEIVNIPDANFKSALIASTAINTNGDGEISVTEAQSYVGNINVVGYNISDLTGIEAFVNTTSLHCEDNKLTTLDVSNNTHLTLLYCYNNTGLNTIDISKNIALTEFACIYNNMSYLDVSANTALTKLHCYGNKLTGLDLSKNTNLTYLNCTDNPNLSEICVWDIDYANSSDFTKDASAAWTTDCATAFVNIPDANFKNALIALGVDTNTDGDISVSEAKSATTIDVSSNSISNLTGIEVFTNLKSLSCYDNSLSDLDISLNTTLIYLNCDDNKLSSLIVSDNVNLKTLHCSNNNLSNIDLFYNSDLKELYCANNNLSSMNVGSNDNLITLSCANNQLSAIDVSSNNKLERLYCYSNKIKNIDIDNNVSLKELYCSGNEIDNINISNNTLLTKFYCSSNSLNSLNVYYNTALSKLDISDNSITSLETTTNTNLIELNASENKLNSINVNSNNKIKLLNVASNQINYLDVWSNSALEYLYCYNNKLTSLDVSNNNNLIYFFAHSNDIDAIVVKSTKRAIVETEAGNYKKDTLTEWIEPNGMPTFSVYPVPANSNLFIESNITGEAEIFDLRGIRVMSNIEINIGLNNINLELSPQAYILIIKGDNYREIKNIIIK
ncbi:MAG: T9SS type A sorting domain-containing protein [Flavobacteriales bacterium]|nr:T9SS type A sorting domain-containing protein [Flavobacteriales bacterium]